ncbi:SUKH-4 family immunity protein [Streptomyces ginkgonis]|uniref:SUKH-4 family immunity protein n=1 Tax=Streptomyces ginkgonis TaxID=1812259 RepID=UPI002176BB73|nr:SUKH-4 family immunity protein [Streptomyces ginkgonis]
MDDAETAGALARCTPCPYPGRWQEAPFAERTVDGVRYAVVALDPGLSALGVRRTDGAVWGLPEDGAPHLVNSSVAAFVACSRAHAEAAAGYDGYDGAGDDGDEDAAERAADALTEALLERFAALDAPAVADENAFWCVAAEELGYGMSV